MENRRNLILKIEIAVSGFSLRTVLWDKNVPISRRLSKNFGKKTFYSLKMENGANVD